jgi:hypothetical protein
MYGAMPHPHSSANRASSDCRCAVVGRATTVTSWRPQPVERRGSSRAMATTGAPMQPHSSPAALCCWPCLAGQHKLHPLTPMTVSASLVQGDDASIQCRKRSAYLTIAGCLCHCRILPTARRVTSNAALCSYCVGAWLSLSRHMISPLEPVSCDMFSVENAISVLLHAAITRRCTHAIGCKPWLHAEDRSGSC